MKYVLRSNYVENTHEEAIDAARFNAIKRSRKVLAAASEIEGIFDNLISNYLEIETRCLELCTRRLARQTIGYREHNETLAAVNLVFVNYLSTGRAYVDKIGKVTSRCFQSPETEQINDEVRLWIAQQFDAAFGFRFMEALRNHVQHSGTALHTLSQGSRKVRVDDQSEVSCESFLEPMCNKIILAERGDFKAKVLDECPDTVN